MKRVLIPTDFSDNAWDALTYAIRLYDDIPCQFYMVNTFQVGVSQTTTLQHRTRDTHLYRLIKEDSENQLKKLKNYIDEHLLNDKHEFKTFAKPGDLPTIINQMVFAENIDMIIMGTTGAAGVKEMFIGSNTTKVISTNTFCPVISVPQKYEYKEVEHILIATDFKKQFTEIDLRCIIELQLLHNFSITVLYINYKNGLTSTQQQNKEALEQLLTYGDVTFTEVKGSKIVAEEVDKFAQYNDIQLIVMGYNKHSFIEHLTHSPTIKKISFHCNIPLFIIPKN
ncbi:MAG: universal stress protein [Flavobacteriaceae bacterium]